MMGAVKLRLILGCNDIERPGYVGVDSTIPDWAKRDYANFAWVDLSTGEMLDPERGNYDKDQDYPHWPWADSSVEDIIAHDVFEHIDNDDYRGSKGIIYCLNEAHRILKPGGILDLKVPCIDFDAEGRQIGSMGAWCDPTHVQVWTQDTRYYFDERWNNPQGERGRLGPGMGTTALFRTLPESESGVDWKPVIYNPKHPERRKLILKLEAVK